MPNLADIAGRPLLVALPADDSTAEVVRVAYELSSRLEAPLEMLHVVPHASLLASGFRGDKQHTKDDERRHRAHDHLVTRVERVASAPAPIEDMLRVETGATARVLVERAEALDAGLLLVGPHRRRGVFDMGSTVRALLTHAPCPVWSQVGAWRQPKRLVVPTDMSTDSRHALSVALRLATRLGADVHLLHAFLELPDPYPPIGGPVREGMPAPPKGQSERLRAETFEHFESFVAECSAESAGLGVTLSSEFVDEDPVTAVLERQSQDRLVVMATQGRGKFSAAVLGSVTYGVLRLAERPVLAVPHPEDRGARARLAVDRFHVTA
jgi:nucleotide-binding universal stress UspA family protein